MPLDGTHYDLEPDLTELQPGKEGLRQLSYLLRHPEKWVEEFKWDFPTFLGVQECCTSGCALGIAELRWGDPAVEDFYGNLPWEMAEPIFEANRVSRKLYGIDLQKVTPTMVADAIDFYLATGRVPIVGEAAP